MIYTNDRGPQVRDGARSVETEPRCVTNLYHGMAYDVIAMPWQHCLRDDLEAY